MGEGVRLPRGDSRGPGASGSSWEQSGSGERLPLLSSSKDELSPDALGKSVRHGGRKQRRERKERKERRERKERTERRERKERKERMRGGQKVRNTLTRSHNINAFFLTLN